MRGCVKWFWDRLFRTSSKRRAISCQVAPEGYRGPLFIKLLTVRHLEAKSCAEYHMIQMDILVGGVFETCSFVAACSYYEERHVPSDSGTAAWSTRV